MLSLIWKMLLLAVVALDVVQNARALKEGVELKTGKFSQWLSVALLAAVALELGLDIITGR